MKTNTLSFLLKLTAIVAACWCQTSLAQMYDNPIDAKVRFFVRGDPNSGQDPEVETEFNGTITYNLFSQGGGWENESTIDETISIGEEYTFDINVVVSMDDYKIIFDVPSNMYILLDEVRRNVIKKSEIVSGSFTVTVLPNDSYGSLGFGDSSGLATGKLQFEIGLGKLSNGASAGTLILTQDAINSNAYKPDALEYVDIYDEIGVEVSGSGVIEQINAPEGLLDINTINSTKYEIDVYDWTQVTGYSGGQYTTTGSPYITYTIDDPGNAGDDWIRIQKDVGTVTYETEAEDQTGGDWEVFDWHDSTETAEKKIVRDYQTATREVIQVIADSTETVLKESEFIFETVDGVKELTEKTTGTDSSDHIVFDPDFNGTGYQGEIGKPSEETLPCGTVIEKEYYHKNNYASNSQPESAIGEIFTITKPYLDGGASGEVVITYTYEDISGKAFVESITEFTDGQLTRSVDFDNDPDTFETKAGVTITKTEVYAEDPDDPNDPNDPYGVYSVDTITNVFKFTLSDSLYRDQIYSQEFPDGTKTAYLYERGDWDDTDKEFDENSTGTTEDYKRIVIISGLAAEIENVTTDINDFDGGGMDNVHCIKQKSTAKAIIKDPSGNVIWEENYVLNSSGTWSTLTSIEYSYDSKNNLTKSERMEYISSAWRNETLYEANYKNNQLDYTIDEAGTKVTYTYDGDGRVETMTKLGWDDSADDFYDQGDIKTTYTYDAAGNVTKVEVTDEGALETLTTEYSYDDAGRRTKITEHGVGTDKYETEFEYFTCSKKIKITYPDDSTETRDYFKDGKLKSIVGTAVPETTYSYSVNNTTDVYDGAQTVKVTYDAGSNDQWTESWLDWIGRTLKVVTPTHDGGTDHVHQNYTYNSDGLLAKVEVNSGTTSTQLAPSKLFEYDDLRNLKREALDTKGTGDNHYGNGVIDFGDDQVTEYNFQYDEFGSIGWYRYEDVHVYSDVGNIGTTPNKKSKVSYSYTKLSKFAEDELFYKQNFDGVNNQKTVTTIEVERATKRKKIITDLPNASGTEDIRETYINGLLAIKETIEGSSDYVDHRFEYDGLGRLSIHDDPRIGNTTTAYHEGTRLVETVDRPDGQTTTYSYDSDSGQLATTMNEQSKYIRTERSYSGEDLWVYTWGDVPNPNKVKYDDLGRRVEMHTYKTGLGWSNINKPTGFNLSGDKTTWIYDGKTGLLDEKKDAASQSYTYAYDDVGRLKTRTDAIGSSGNVTTYNYFDASYAPSGTFSGELRMVDYPTGTTDLEYTYTRWGALKTVKDDAGTRTFTHKADFQVDEEQLGNFYDYDDVEDQMELQYTYATSGVVGRLTDFKVQAGIATLVDNSYDYDAVTGRLDEVEGHGQTFDISYLSNSHLINEYQSGSFERHINRESNSNHISSIESEWSNSDRVRFTYFYDSLGRESTRYMYGTIRNAYGSGITSMKRVSTYNDRNELKTSKTQVEIDESWEDLVARTHTYNYDEMGNRTSVVRNGHTTSYTTNNLNQYTARTNDHQVVVEGTSTDSTVKVYETGQTQVTASRKDDYFYRDWDTGGSANDYPEINVKEGSTVTSTGDVWVPKTSETSITYDDNGNLTGDALWTYTYDHENRLTKMVETSGAATAGFPDTEITFKYDYLGRRIEKKVKRGATTESYIRFVWRGWHMVAELNASSNNAKIKTYTWGPDISGSFGGAGGNGGVLVMKDHSQGINETFFPAYDRQGNVYGLIDTSGNLDAEYEYDPFGKLIRYSGDRADSMSLLYSTKYHDAETGLVYYGHRFYDPKQGRFINQDPIGVDGGINIYAMVGNNLINRADYLGLHWIEECDPDSDEFDEDLCEEKTLDAIRLGLRWEVNGYADGAARELYDSGNDIVGGAEPIGGDDQEEPTDDGNETGGRPSPATGDDPTQKENDTDCEEVESPNGVVEAMVAVVEEQIHTHISTLINEQIRIAQRFTNLFID